MKENLSNTPIIVVSASRMNREAFNTSAIYSSIDRMKHYDKRIVLLPVCSNSVSLSAIYNQFIIDTIKDCFIVFIHDDIWIEDMFFVDNISRALEQFDIVGIAGNRRIPPRGPTWFCLEDETQDQDNLSGGIFQHDPMLGSVIEPNNFCYFGPCPADVQLLDGAMIAARGSTLIESGVRFDEQFDFHFYDLDFSRTANQAGLRVGTWPIPLIHLSKGNFRSESWKKNMLLYRKKWGWD